MKKRIIATVLSAIIATNGLLALAGCEKKVSASTDLMEGVKPRTVGTDAKLVDSGATALADFSLRLFGSAFDEEGNILVSPLSALFALGMTANGTQGETRAQMEDTFGLTVDELNQYLYVYMKSLPSEEQYKLSMANGIWLNDSADFTANPDFLQTNADRYGAAIHKAPFDDETKDQINEFVNENTAEMIPSILDDIQPDELMYLVNALAFEAEWAKVYEEFNVREGEFTNADGEQKIVDMMYSQEDLYIEDEFATGFIKPYVDDKYAFVALLPNEGISVMDYASSLTGENLRTLLDNAEATTIDTAMPKFKSEYSTLLNDSLRDIGIIDLFDGSKADLSELGTSKTGNLFVNRVIHKTFIEVDELGTKAGAATVVGIAKASLPIITHEVYLNRPFLYMLIDREHNLPLFVGAELFME
ncbi:MAG: serpin family protein [Fastidiosipilaceae bacterium]|jgi:serine protease inhibitor